MALVLISGREVDVTESTDEVLRRIAEARERGPAFAGQPVGWVILTPSDDTSRTVYVQSSAIGWVQDNA